ncbi:DUF4224 domain-containing protein [Phocoenobacter skyensis]|uniref:DUF4224 domain-containing protein n=1 Tax=Phocoenobacter skyensis TaxID=97481 RepID=A0ABT9JIA3_9PAST|nr:DUF4224 domain-containing protein [Pasteurella skyensis]MDP8078374.1 DUF4224 domain-containing protein [Pasteurella skyensis]MDP8084534.1 DUF4224 domain-containing protein [Pasteurella skyensis]
MEIATKEQLIRTTGYKNKSKQIDWLRKQGKNFQINKFGEPIITEYALFDMPVPKQSKPKPQWQPKI